MAVNTELAKLDDGKKTLVMQSDNPVGFLILYSGRYRLDGDKLTVCLGDLALTSQQLVDAPGERLAAHPHPVHLAEDELAGGELGGPLPHQDQGAQLAVGALQP